MKIDAQEIANEFSVQLGMLLDQSLDKINHCIGQIDEQQLWLRPAAGINSIGNLLLHINGNLHQWSTIALNELTDNRDRDSEFADGQTITKADLVRKTQQHVEQAKQTIDTVAAGQLLQTINVQGFELNVMKALLHTTAHFQGHTHQIILLTRLITKDNYVFHWTPEMSRDQLPM